MIQMKKRRREDFDMTREPIRFGEMIQLIKEDWASNQRDWTRPGFRALFVYRFGVWISGLKSRIARVILVRFQAMMYRYVRNHYGIELPSGAKVGRRLLIGHQCGVIVHPRAEIGDDCVIRQNVTVGAASDQRTWEAPKLGNRVKVGCGAAILGKAQVGDDVRIGPNVVVLANVPSGATVFTPPPRTVVMQLNGKNEANGAMEDQPIETARPAPTR